MTATVHDLEDLRRARDFTERFRSASDEEAATLLASDEGQAWFVDYGPTMPDDVLRRAVDIIGETIPEGAFWAILGVTPTVM